VSVSQYSLKELTIPLCKQADRRLMISVGDEKVEHCYFAWETQAEMVEEI